MIGLAALAKPKWIIIAGLGVALAVQSARLSHRASQLSDCRETVSAREAVRDAYATALAASETAYRIAEQSALRMAVDAAEAEENRTKDIAHAAQKSADDRVRAALAGLRTKAPAATDQRPSRNAHLPAPANHPGFSAQGPGAAIMDGAVIDADRATCTANTIYLEEAVLWADKLAPTSSPLVLSAEPVEASKDGERESQPD